MISSSFRRKIAVLLLAGVLAAPWVLAEEPRSQPGPARAGASDQAPLDLLSRLWRALASLWGEEGCSVDPAGRCITSPGGSTSDTGTTGDNGCSVDPYGRCIGGS